MVQIFFLHPKGLSCMHPTLETTDHHFKSTNIKLKLEVTNTEGGIFWPTSKISHHASPNGWLTNDKTLPSCKKKAWHRTQHFDSSRED